ncbi:MAG: clostripain-related cysteine peptidase [Bacillota bacterium]
MKKKWTVLFYANGNNEFEPEMHKMVQNIKEIESPQEMNIVIQYSRADRRLAEILRPHVFINELEENWTGTQRIAITPKTSRFLENTQTTNLGFLNMADAKVLFEFIQWGMESFPAERYMVVLGGHSFEYLGTLTDYTQDMPYIMGIPEMAKALNLVSSKIDILILDTCYMNMVEILYELAAKRNTTAQYILTYIEYGPISGLPIGEILHLVMENSTLATGEVLKKIIEQINLDLAVFTPSKNKLERIKNSSDQLARYILQSPGDINCCLKDILENKAELPKEPAGYVDNLNKDLESLIFAYKRIRNYSSPVLQIAHKKTQNKLARCYLNLAFNHNNRWSLLLGEIFNLPPKQKYTAKLEPTILPLQALISLIAVMNPQADEIELNQLLRDLLSYKKWDKFTNYQLRP